MRTEGSAYLDRSGRVLAADPAFRAALGLRAGDVTEALRERARADPAVADLVAGQGPDRTSLAASGSLPGCELTRTSCGDGILLRAGVDGALPGSGEELDSAPATAPDGAESAELAIQAIALARLAGSVAHEVKNPLNAMALQVALLGDKIASADERLGDACAANLSSIKNQIGRINEVVRRYVDVADPAAAPGGFDAGGLLADVATLFGHELRRRRITLRCDAPPGVVRAAGDGIRATRLLLGLVWRAVSQTPSGGQLSIHCAPTHGPFAELVLERPAGPPDPALEWMDAIVASAARDLGGRLEQACIDGQHRVALKLPKEITP